MSEWELQVCLVHDCIRSCVFGDYLATKGPKTGAWPSIMDMCYQDAVITWNKLFGQRSQETHWSKFATKISIPNGDKLKPFDKEMILGYLEISDYEWSIFRKSMVDVRNVRFAHLNIQINVDELPNITLAMHACYIYREWLVEALHLQNRLGLKIRITEQTGQYVLSEFRKQIENACNGLQEIRAFK